MAPSSNLHKKILIEILNDPEKLKLLFQRAQKLDPDFERSGDALLCWLILENAGITTPFMLAPAAFVSGINSPKGLVPLIVSFRWKAYAKEEYSGEAGDMFVITDEKRVPARIGFVAKGAATTAGERFKGVHSRCKQAEMISIDNITYWLSFG